MHMFMHMFTHMSINTFLFDGFPISVASHMSMHMPMHMSTHMSVHMPTRIPACMHMFIYRHIFRWCPDLCARSGDLHYHVQPIDHLFFLEAHVCTYDLSYTCNVGPSLEPRFELYLAPARFFFMFGLGGKRAS